MRLYYFLLVTLWSRCAISIVIIFPNREYKKLFFHIVEWRVAMACGGDVLHCVQCQIETLNVTPVQGWGVKSVMWKIGFWIDTLIRHLIFFSLYLWSKVRSFWKMGTNVLVCHLVLFSLYWHWLGSFDRSILSQYWQRLKYCTDTA